MLIVFMQKGEKGEFAGNYCWKIILYGSFVFPHGLPAKILTSLYSGLSFLASSKEVYIVNNLER